VRIAFSRPRLEARRLTVPTSLSPYLVEDVR